MASGSRGSRSSTTTAARIACSASSFCLFGVYGVDGDKRIQVQNNDNCKTNCPACSRVCPEAAIMFPKYKAGPINGDVVSDADLQKEKMKVDISALLGGDVYAMLRLRSEKAKSRFSKERDSDKALAERQKCLVKLAAHGRHPARGADVAALAGGDRPPRRGSRRKSAGRTRRSAMTAVPRVLLRVLVAIACSLSLPAAEPDRPAGKTHVVLIGDSTVASKSGWGDAFGKLLGDRAECFNDAKGGSSSKSFRDGGYWKTAIARKPDWLLVQFGHNDQPGKGPTRETDPATTFSENLRRYVDEARAAGARPVLVTSLTRRTFEDGRLIQGFLAGYAEATRRIAAEKQVPLVDLNARSIEQVEKLGPGGLDEMEPDDKAPGAKDHTHLTARGGEMVAPLVVEELRKCAPELAALCAAPR